MFEANSRYMNDVKVKKFNCFPETSVSERAVSCESAVACVLCERDCHESSHKLLKLRRIRTSGQTFSIQYIE